MPEQHEALEAYRDAARLGKRAVHERHASHSSGLLPALETIVRDTCGEFPLGCYEVPLKKITGTFAGGRQSAFSCNFMPLLDENTEFSSKWQALYQIHCSEGISDPIKVYEYLGLYYVVEGHKRVSVYAYADVYSIRADVTRLLPPVDENNLENTVFYEYLDGDKKRVINHHMWFSRPGRITMLRGIEKAVSEKLCLTPGRSVLEDSFFDFRKAYHSLGFSNLSITTGDAFLEYALIYGLPLGLSDSELKKNIKTCLPQFEQYASPPDTGVISNPSELSQVYEQRGLLSRIVRSKNLAVCFVFTETPETNFWTAAHSAGKFALEREFAACRVTSCLSTDRAGDISKLADTSDLLFVTDQKLGSLALRLALENRGTAVLHCASDTKHTILPTYYGAPQEPAFLCGVLAGALTRTGSVGYIKGRSATGTLYGDAQAFAQGARSVRPAVRVHYRNPADRTLVGLRSAQASLARHGCDMVWIPHLPGYPAQRKIFPGVYGHLCGLDPMGLVVRCYASSAYHWEAFYTQTVRNLLDGLLPGSVNSPFHMRMGLSSGVLNVHPVYPDISPRVRRLLEQYHFLITSGRCEVLDENMCVEIIEN